MKRITLALLAGVLILPLIFLASFRKHSGASAKISTADTLKFRSLLILRHAKSDHSEKEDDDFDRPLSDEGVKEAEEMGEFMKEHEKWVDLIVASPSARTRQTIQIICKKAGYDFKAVVWDSSLYQCNVNHFIQQVRKVNDDYHTVLFVGHNSAITGVVNKLQSTQHFDEIKTCGLVDLYYPDAHWANVGTQNAVLSYYHKPK